MKYNPEIKHRCSIRLKGHDYSRSATFFVTICVKNQVEYLGEVRDGKMVLNEFGRFVKNCWDNLPNHFKNCKLDKFIIMPNHVHGIIILIGNRKGTYGPLYTLKQGQFGKPIPGSLPTLIRSFKSAVTRHFNILYNTPGNPFWQRNYYEHIIWNKMELDRIRKYIIDNPIKWEFDKFNPNNKSGGPQSIRRARHAVPLQYG